MKWPILSAIALLSLWALPGCPQATQPFGGMASPTGDTAVTDAPPQGPDVTADAEPIEPKNDPKAIGGGTATGGSTDSEEEKVSADQLKFGPLKVVPPVDVRLRYGDDSKVLAKTPPASYVIHAKSSKIALSFFADVSWDPALADSYWLALTDSFDFKPQLRAVYIPANPNHHVLYSDADRTTDTAGNAVYSFSDLTVWDGGELRFFIKETKTADFHTGGLVSLDSDDAAKPFPSDAEAKIYPVGSFQMKAIIFSPASEPIVRQKAGPTFQ